MSDSDTGDDGTDTGGGDDGGIDKEALREELREKYERDEREREATQRMSDLLLKGATMTNAHCGTCGDPLFQQNGTTFCPSCHGGPEGVEASIGDDEASVEGDESEGGHEIEVDPTETVADGESASGSLEGPPAAPDVSEERSTDRRSLDTTPPESTDRVPSPRDPDAPSIDDAATDPSPRGDPGDRSPTGVGVGTGDPSSVAPAAPSIPRDGGDIDAARESLVTSLERFARAAAETDDPRYARECLEAAREAAEALAALR